MQALFYPLRHFGPVKNTTLTGLPEMDRQVFLKWMEEGTKYTIDSTIDRTCILRPNLLRRYTAIKREYQAYQKLRDALKRPKPANIEADKKLPGYGLLWVERRFGTGQLDEWRERMAVPAMEVLREQLNDFVKSMSGEEMQMLVELAGAGGHLYGEFQKARRVRVALWALDKYEELE